MKTKDLFGITGTMQSMSYLKRRKKDDAWYKKITSAEPKKVYRNCPNCGKRVGIPVIYPTQWCYMCGETIYADEVENEKARKKYEFMRKMKGINENDKKTIRRKKVSKEIQHN
jgi:hypothetical protein